MNRLPTVFKKNDFDHLLIKRDGDFAIFWRKAPHHQDAHYEVIVVQQKPARTFPNGDSVPERECYPSSEQWGTAGWTYNSLADAEVRFRKLLDAEQKVTK